MRAVPELRLLGHGLDAIVIPTARPLNWLERLFRVGAPTDHRYLRTISDSDRLARYLDAALFNPMYRDQQLLDLRECRGANYLKAWRTGNFPKVGRIRHLIAIPRLSLFRRANSARG